jgi:putative membrane protein
VIRFDTPTRVNSRPYLTTALIAAWVLAMISLPIQRWLWGDSALPAGITLGVTLQVIAVVAILVGSWGVRRALIAVAVIVIAAWLTEYVGHTTGFPFGAYRYTDRLQPQIGGVPLLIPFAWLMMLPPAWTVAQRITRRINGARGRIAFAAVSALAFTAWDLFLDPQMAAWSLWLWDDPGAWSYFGIPWINFAGWLLASGLITMLSAAFAPIRDLPVRPLLIVYILTWLLETIGLIAFWGLPLPGLVGFAAMGLMLVWAWRASRD